MDIRNFKDIQADIQLDIQADIQVDIQADIRKFNQGGEER